MLKPKYKTYKTTSSIDVYFFRSLYMRSVTTVSIENLSVGRNCSSILLFDYFSPPQDDDTTDSELAPENLSLKKNYATTDRIESPSSPPSAAPSSVISTVADRNNHFYSLSQSLHLSGHSLHQHLPSTQLHPPSHFNPFLTSPDIQQQQHHHHHQIPVTAFTPTQSSPPPPHHFDGQNKSPVDVLRRVFPARKRAEIETALQRCKGDVLQAIEFMVSTNYLEKCVFESFRISIRYRIFLMAIGIFFC